MGRWNNGKEIKSKQCKKKLVSEINNCALFGLGNKSMRCVWKYVSERALRLHLYLNFGWFLFSLFFEVQEIYL